MLEAVIVWDDDRDLFMPQWVVRVFENDRFLDGWDLWDGHGVADSNDSDAEMVRQAHVEIEEHLGRKPDKVWVNRSTVPSSEALREIDEAWPDEAERRRRGDTDFCR